MILKKNLIVALLLVLFICGICSNAYSKTHSGIIAMKVDLSVRGQGQTARLWIPHPVSDRDQLISNIQTSGDYSDIGVYTDRSYGTPILYAEWPKDATSRKLKFSFKLERQEIRRHTFPTQEPNWNSADYEKYLKPTSLGSIDGEVKKTSRHHHQKKKTVLKKAKAIYDWICENI